MKKSKGPSVFPIGGKFPVNIGEGGDQRQFYPGRPATGRGPGTFPQGTRFGNTGGTDMQRAHNPPKVAGKGPQTHKSSRFGDLKNQNQDSSTPFNP